MSDGYTVVLGDLTTMASNFRSAQKSFDGLKPDIEPTQVSSGSAALDSQVKAALAVFKVLNIKMSETLDEHAKLLESTRDSYKRHDIDNRFMFDDMVPEQ